MIPTRADEPEYAKLYDPVSDYINRYGSPIDLIATDSNGDSLCINGDEEIGSNPNRTKQHAFHFNADNCIGCHACEAACSEKNDLPPHLSFRSVGYVEGGTYPNYQRLNISMACNHCDDPVCLKGCPTRAYTKHPEYGAVIQDPDICFGCGYCTWVCPYNAPQLDPLAGQVEKCNMCVDRLEVGLKPACVSACVGNALDFGVVENIPTGSEQIETTIPGFPDPEITQPNIRFQQLERTPAELTRPDSAPVKYHRNTESGEFKPIVDQKVGSRSHWNLRRLSSRENPLVIFTLATQAAVGAFIGAFVSDLSNHTWSYVALLTIVLGLVGLGLLMSTMHLGKPFRFYRGFNNLRWSPVSREGLATVVFGGAVFLHGVTSMFPALSLLAKGFGLIGVVSGLATLVFMVQCYLIKARPFWNHWQTTTAFFGTALNMGGWLVIGSGLLAQSSVSLIGLWSVILGLLLESVGLYFHRRDMAGADHEGAASHYVQTSTFGKCYVTRNILLFVALATLVFWMLFPVSTLSLAAAFLACVTTAVIGRALFYVLVIPTTMPGAFFWKNKAFEQHARDIGLAANPNAGVALTDH